MVTVAITNTLLYGDVRDTPRCPVTIPLLWE